MLIVISEYLVHAMSCDWRASEASETLSGVYKFELVRYVYVYMYIYIYICMEVRMSY